MGEGPLHWIAEDRDEFWNNIAVHCLNSRNHLLPAVEICWSRFSTGWETLRSLEMPSQENIYTFIPEYIVVEEMRLFILR